MSYSLNKVALGGYLTRDVEIKRVGRNETPVALFGLALNRRVKRGQEWVDEPVFVDVQLWGARGEAFARHHEKGSPCLLPDCELVWEKWTDREGQERTKLFVQARGFSFLPKPKTGQDGRRSLDDENVPF